MSFKRKFAPIASTYSVRQGQGRQGITVRGRDYITDITTASDGSTLRSAYYQVLSPAKQSMFPWMANMAVLFDTYKFLDLKFVYESQCPSTEKGSVILYWDPDPTAAVASDWSNASQRGVNVHGAVWSRHILSVPQALCSSRREYYVRATFPAINLTGAFAYDPLEYFPGCIGVALQGHSTGAGPWGKLYVEYSIVFGKANESSEPATALAGTGIIAPFAQGSKNQYVQRTIQNTDATANYVLIGPGQPDTIANNRQSMAGWSMLVPDQAFNWTAPQPVELRFGVSASSNATAWTSNPVLVGVKPANAGGYTNSSTDVTIGGIQYARRVYDAGVGTTAYLAIFAVRLNTGDAVQVLMGSTANNWYGAGTGYAIRMYSAAYNAD